MVGIGWALVGIAAWLIYSGYTGISPLKTVADIIRRPSNAQSIVTQNRSTGGGKVAETNPPGKPDENPIK